MVSGRPGVDASAPWIRGRGPAVRRQSPEGNPSDAWPLRSHRFGEALAESWDCPVYVSESEMPFVTGKRAYPPPDPSVGGGMMSFLSFAYPRGPYDLGDRAASCRPAARFRPRGLALDFDARSHHRTHLAVPRPRRNAHRRRRIRDAAPGSAIGVLTMLPAVSRPPAYFTTDWDCGEESIRGLRDLQPNIALTGHGRPMYGERLRSGLRPC